MIQQRVGLRLPQPQVLKKVQQQADFVERQPHDRHLIRDGDDDLDSEFAAAQHAGNLSESALRPAIDFVGDEHRLPVFQTPHRPRVRELAIVLGDAGGKDWFRAPRLPNFLRRGDSSASQRPILFRRLVSASRLPLFFGPQRKRLRHFPSRLRPRLPLQLRDPPLHGRDHIDQPLPINPPRAEFIPELLCIHNPSIIHFPIPTQRQFHRVDSYRQTGRRAGFTAHHPVGMRGA